MHVLFWLETMWCAECTNKERFLPNANMSTTKVCACVCVFRHVSLKGLINSTHMKSCSYASCTDGNPSNLLTNYPQWGGTLFTERCPVCNNQHVTARKTPKSNHFNHKQLVVKWFQVRLRWPKCVFASKR